MSSVGLRVGEARRGSSATASKAPVPHGTSRRWFIVAGSPASGVLYRAQPYREVFQLNQTLPKPRHALALLKVRGDVRDARAFRSGRQFAAWLGLVPRQNSSGGKDRLGGISKMGDRYLRHLLVIGATAVVREGEAGWARDRHSLRAPCSAIART